MLPKEPVVMNAVAVIVPVTVPPLFASNELLARTKAALAVFHAIEALAVVALRLAAANAPFA
jgi:hypothetical protein